MPRPCARRRRGAHQQGPDQAGPCRIGHATEVRGGHAGLLQGLPDQGQQLAHVVATGQFRHHAAVLGMQGDLAEEGMGSGPGQLLRGPSAAGATPVSSQEVSTPKTGFEFFISITL